MNKTKIINLTGKPTKPFGPEGTQWYPIAIIAPMDIAEEIKSFLEKSPYIQHTDSWPIPKEGWLPFDWLYFYTGDESNRSWYICISERVYNDSGFRLIIMEYLI